MTKCGIRLRSMRTTTLALGPLAVLATASVLGLIGCGAGSNTYSPIVKPTGVQPGFSIAVSPSSVTVTVGNSASYTVTISDSGGFNTLVTLSASDLPSGSTATFGTPTATATGSTVPLSISTTNQAAAGADVVGKVAISKSGAAATRLSGTLNTTFTITGTASGITQTATAIIKVTAAPDFSIAITPATVTIPESITAQYTVTLTALGSFDISTVTLVSPTGLPANTRATYGAPTPTAIGETIPLTIQTSTDSQTPTGNSTFTVSGTGTGITHTGTAILAVTSFTVTITPASKSVATGGSVQYTVTLTSHNGFSLPVTLAVFGVPALGTTSTFASPVLTPTAAGVSTTLTITSNSVTTPFGTFPITVTGTNGIGGNGSEIASGGSATLIFYPG